jgi:arsenate reductase
MNMDSVSTTTGRQTRLRARNMEQVKIYHNGQCTKSGGALELLVKNNIPHEVRFYTAEPLSEEELRSLLKKLDIPAEELARKNERSYIDQYHAQKFDEDGWIKLLLTHPELMQRPIIEQGDKAFIARPPEKLLTLLK